MMLLTIVIVFIICHSIRSVVNVYECIQVLEVTRIKSEA